MLINTENPIIKYSEKGKPFPYDKLLYETLNDYILDYKNARLDKLTEHDQAVCLARIIRKMEVNDVPVQQFFKEDLDRWSEQMSNFAKINKLLDVIAKDMFCCFDKNRYDENGEFDVCDRLYCVNNDGERDYVYAEEYVKGKFIKKQLSEESKYFRQLMEFNAAGRLPKEKKDCI